MTREEIVQKLVAENNGKKDELITAIEKAMGYGYKVAVDKACDWLRAELDKEEGLHYIHVHGFDKERREIFLEDFRKAMKGGKE